VNVLFLHTYRDWGGGETSLTAIAEGLLGRGHRATIVCRPGSALHQRAPSLKSATLPLRIAGDFDPITIWTLSRLIARQRVDIVCAHTSKELRVGGTAARLARVPVVMSQEIDLPIRNTRLNRIFYGRVASAIMVNSVATKRTLLAGAPWLPPDRVTVVLKGIDGDRFARAQPAELRKETGLSGQAIVVGFVGRLDDSQKGVTTLLEAMAIVVRHSHDVALVMAGDGPTKEAATSFIRECALSRSVHLTGFRDDIPSFMKALDFLVMPSNFEGFGYAAVEAMAAGKPVIATSVSSLPEIVEDGITGVLVPPKNPQQLADAMLALAADAPRRAALGAAGAQRVARHFTTAAMLHKVEALFADTIAAFAP
jgi:glycosyltransferase involved in cell wall biosynthesis